MRSRLYLLFPIFVPFALFVGGCSSEAGSSGSGASFGGSGGTGGFGGPSGSATTLATTPNEPTGGIVTDGTHVYFATTAASSGTSTQQHGNLYYVSSDGTPKQIQGVNPSPDSIAVDEFYVYYTTFDHTGVARVMKDGTSGGQTLASQLPAPASGIALTSDAVIVSTTAGIVSVPKVGGAVTTIADDPNGAAAVVADQFNAYWVDRGTTGTTGGTIMRASLSGGGATTLASAPALTSTWLFALAQDSDSLYFPDPNAGRVYRMSKTNGGVSVVATGVATPSAVVVDDTNVYFTQTADGQTDQRAIYMAPKTGASTPVEIVSASSSGVYGLAVDATNIYWTNDVTTGSVYESSKSGNGYSEQYSDGSGDNASSQ